MKLIIERLSPTAKLPTRAYANDAGLDLYSNEELNIKSGKHVLIKTGIKMSIPENCVGLIWDKSGLAKEGLHTLGGVIDSGYRGEILVELLNISNGTYIIRNGQKIAQILIQKVESPKIIEGKVEINTDRAEGGHGSSGKY